MSTEPGWPQQPEQSSSGASPGSNTPSPSSPYAPGDPNATQQFPAPPAAGSFQAAPTASYGQPPAGGYGSSAGNGQPPAGGYGQGGYGQPPAGYGTGGTGGTGGGYGGGGYQPQPPKKNNAALIAIGVVAVAVIALAAIFLPRLLGGSSDPTPTVAASPTQTTEPTQTTGTTEPTQSMEAPAVSDQPVQIGTRDVFDIAPGDCMLYVDVDQIPNSMPLYDCTAPHDAEVYDEFVMTQGSYPGEETTQAQAEQYCLDRFQPYVGTAYDQSALYLYYYYPTDGTWNSAAQDRLITCIVYDTAYYTGLLQGSNR